MRTSLNILGVPLLSLAFALCLPTSAFAEIIYNSTIGVTVDTGQIGTIKSLKVMDDGTMYVLGSSTTKMERISADGITGDIITFGTALPATPINFTATGNTLYIQTTGTQIVKHTVSGTSTTLTASGTFASASVGDIVIRPGGSLYANKSRSMYALDSALHVTASGTTSANVAYRLALGSDGTVYALNILGKVVRSFTLSGSTFTADTTFHVLPDSRGSGPTAMFTSPDGFLYVANAFNSGTIHSVSIPAGVDQWSYNSSSGSGSITILAATHIDRAGYFYTINTSGVVKKFEQVSAISNLTASAASSTITLNWTNPPSHFSSVTIRRSSTGYPASLTGGTLVATNVTGTSYSDTGLPDNIYYYSVFAKNSNGNYGSAVQAKATVDTSRADALSPYVYLPLDAQGSPLAADVSGHGFNAELYNAAPTLSTDVPSPGFTDSHSFAFSQADSQALQMPRPVQDDFTLCAWIKTTGVGIVDTHYQSMELFGAEMPGYQPEFGVGVGVEGQLIFGVADENLVDYNLYSTSAVNTGTWTHVCATRRKVNGEMIVYVNGVAENTTYGSTESLNANPTMVIGAATDGGADWDGNIDDVRIYNTVLSPQDIAAIADGSAFVVSTTASTTVDPVPTQSSGGHRGSGSLPHVTVIAHAAAPAVTPVMTNATLTGLQVRTCTRVKKEFKGNAFIRVNERLLKRLGFGC